MGPRIAIGSIFTECNHFCGVSLKLADFERTELLRGEEVLKQSAGTVGGMLHVLRKQNTQVAPLLVASACPGGPIAANCYTWLKDELLKRLRLAFPVDGVLLALHGAATAENADDVEGDLIEAVRHIIGPAVPIVATLDLHAHVTEKMVQTSDALLAWETYPHRDAFSTGERGARMLLDIVAGKCRPTMALAKVPVIVSGIHGGTEGSGPFADCMRFAKGLEGHDGVLSTSLFLVHPYLDLPDMGGGGLVITDNDAEKAADLAEKIARLYWSRRTDLEPLVHSPQAAIELGQKIEGGPVLLVETADCCGGGAAGDSVATLQALLAANIRERALVPVVDPLIASLCHATGIGSRLRVQLGHRVDPRWGTPVEVSGEVIRLTDGKFRYSGGIWDGQLGDMGPTAVFRIGPIDVMIASHATYDWNDEQFQSVGLDVRQAKFVVVKNPMNFQMAYGSLAKAAYILDTPGPTPATLKHVHFRRLQRPYFPADLEIPSLAPRIYQSIRNSWYPQSLPRG
jgi:microcystin degradation protein MlrC